MTYFVYPSGTPSHNEILEARSSLLLSSPYMPPGLVISWRQDGTVIKTGNTSNVYDLTINSIPKILHKFWYTNETKEVGEYVTPTGNSFAYKCITRGLTGLSEPVWPLIIGQQVVDGSVIWECIDISFDASDSGCVIDFIIGGTETSTSVVLSNNLPTVSGAGPVANAYGVVPVSPVFVWNFVDIDTDPQFYYRLLIGSLPLTGDFYDSGKIFSDIQTLTLPVTLPNSLNFHWSLYLSDGAKVNPTDPDVPEPMRREILTSGTGITNTVPIVSDIKLDGISPGTDVPSKRPTITWTYSDPDGEPQKEFRIVIYDSNSQLVWDSGIMNGSGQSALYNFDNSGEDLPSHESLSVTVTAYDLTGDSGSDTAIFVISNPPVIDKIGVDNRLNPLNLNDYTPTFSWEYSDLDEDPLIAYEIRIADNDTDLGTYSFIGNVWNPGPVLTPEAHLTKYDPDSCYYGDLITSIIYYFQVQVQDAYQKSDWRTGYFRLNRAPSASNLKIIPMSPYHNQDLTATYNFVDDSGEVESSKTEIKWYRKMRLETSFSEVTSVRNKKTVSSSNLLPYDQWYFTVRPHDGTEYGNLETSMIAIVTNRKPSLSNLEILPSNPKNYDNLNASFMTSDEDGDVVTVKIKWFKNGVEQADFRDSLIVPSSATELDDEWFCIATPNDSYDDGPFKQSPVVKIINSKPKVMSMTVGSKITPRNLSDGNPVIAWRYSDPDDQAQQAYRFVMGTRPAKTKTLNGLIPASTSKPNKEQGIISTASSLGTLVSGYDVYDSGIVQKSDSYFQYITTDYVPSVVLGPLDATNYNGYVLDTDSETFILGQDKNNGSVLFSFSGNPGLYDVELIYKLNETKRSRLRLSVDGLKIDEFITETGVGIKSRISPTVNISENSSISIFGIPVDSGSKCWFQKIRLIPVLEFTVKAGDFSNLSGYVSDDNSVIRLLGLAGTASMNFPYPSGTYNLDLTYITEASGSPSLSLMVGSSVVMSFNYEIGTSTRTRSISGVQIASGDVIKISGVRNAGAAARVEKISFSPTDGLKLGSKLSEGYTYYGSVSVFDGREWSDWNTTKFSMSGSAWVNGVSNSRGWTIESRISLANDEEVI